MSHEIRCTPPVTSSSPDDDETMPATFASSSSLRSVRRKAGSEFAGPPARGRSTHAPASVPFSFASSSSFLLLGARTALPRTAPFVPAVHAIVMNSSAFDSGWMTRPNHGPRLNPTGNSPHDSSRAFSIPNDANRSRTHSQALVRLSEPVSLGPIRLQSTSRWSITWDSSCPTETICSTSTLLAFALSLLSAAPAKDGTESPIATTHATQKRRLMCNLLVGESPKT